MPLSCAWRRSAPWALAARAAAHLWPAHNQPLPLSSIHHQLLPGHLRPSALTSTPPSTCCRTATSAPANLRTCHGRRSAIRRTAGWRRSRVASGRTAGSKLRCTRSATRTTASSHQPSSDSTPRALASCHKPGGGGAESLISACRAFLRPESKQDDTHGMPLLRIGGCADCWHVAGRRADGSLTCVGIRAARCIRCCWLRDHCWTRLNRSSGS